MAYYPKGILFFGESLNRKLAAGSDNRRVAV
ncbi:hypothetical protein GMJAKD_17710 [Candidatus Electrothrix aarhusensis]